jgi:hypothetical protein
MAEAFPIHDASDFKAWALQERNAAALLREIIWRWRGTSARVRGKPGKWVVYPRERWAELTGMSLDKVKRALRKLELDRLILRERHRFAGTSVRSYYQPTKLALEHMGRPADMARIEEPGAPADLPALAPSLAPAPAPTGAPTDHTSFPSGSSAQPVHPSLPEKGTGPIASEGKGKAPKKLKLKAANHASKCLSTPQTTPTPQSPPPPAAVPADPFPVLPGPHQAKVKHPAKQFDGWETYSSEVKAKLYAKYVGYVDNWNKAHPVKKADWNGHNKLGGLMAAALHLLDDDADACDLDLDTLTDYDDPAFQAAFKANWKAP